MFNDNPLYNWFVFTICKKSTIAKGNLYSSCLNRVRKAQTYLQSIFCNIVIRIIVIVKRDCCLIEKSNQFGNVLNHRWQFKVVWTALLFPDMYHQ